MAIQPDKRGYRLEGVHKLPGAEEIPDIEVENEFVDDRVDDFAEAL